MGKWAGLLAAAMLTAAAQAQENTDSTAGASRVVTLPDGRTATVPAVPPDHPPVENAPVENAPAENAPEGGSLQARSAAYPPSPYLIRATRWSEADERDFGRFVAELGASGCNTVNACLHDPRNPFRASDPPALVFRADCADFPYYMRFYYAWKRGLPFSFENAVEPRGAARDLRYSASGNRVVSRLDPAGENGYAVLEYLRDAVSSATYRIHPELETPEAQDFYSPALTPAAIRPGTVIYDPNGHLAIVWKVEADGRIRYLDAHPDYTVSRGFFDVRFVRSSPGMGAGFKNWRPQSLEGASKAADGSYQGGHIVLAPNAAIAAYSLEQYFGNGPRPADDRHWKEGSFTFNGETLGFYDYVRGRMAGGTLRFDPLREIGDMVDSNCADLAYRGLAVDIALAAGLQKRPEPGRLPPNIYGTEGDWESYSTPSRDARLKTAFKELYDSARRFAQMAATADPKLAYNGKTLAADMLAVYDAHAARCKIGYSRSDGSKIGFGYEEARRRLFAFSFDPYHCAERRWGAAGAEIKTCPDDGLKAAWYAAEQPLRNQIERSYDSRMDFTLAELQTPGPGKGVAAPPETDLRRWLLSQIPSQPPAKAPAPAPAPWWQWLSRP